MAKGINHMQAPLSEEEFKEVNIYLIQNGIKVKGDWLRDLILKEVRGDDYTVRVQQAVSTPEKSVRRLEPR